MKKGNAYALTIWILKIISLLPLVDLIFQFLALVLRLLNFPVRHPLRVVSVLTLQRL